LKAKWLVFICLVMFFLPGCTNQEQLMEREQQILQLENENKQLKLSLEISEEKYEIQSEKLAEAVKEISDLENELKKSEDLSDYVNDGDEALINHLIFENRILYELIDKDRTLMDDDYRLKSYMDLRFIEEGNKIGDFIIDEYSTDNERFFRIFSIRLTGSKVLSGRFVHISNADHNGIVFQIEESDSNKLPYVIELQNIQYLHINNLEDYLCKSDVDLLINDTVEEIEKNIEVTKLFVSGQLGSDIFYSCIID
jgi:hypothetical protein